jgi:hypothetical protein
MDFNLNTPQMNKIVILTCFLLNTQILFCQNNIKVEQLFITNKLNNKSVKIFDNEEKLKNFGEIKRIEIPDQSLTTPDDAKEYIFDGIVFYISVKGRISSFEINSKDFMVEKKGKFSISPGCSLSDIKEIFPEEVKDTLIINYGIDKEPLLTVILHLSVFNDYLNKDIDTDNCSLDLLFNPKSLILEKIYLWIRP